VEPDFSIIKGTRHVGLVCSDIEKSVKFYEELGFVSESTPKEESGIKAEFLVGIEKVIYKTVKLHLAHDKSTLWQESGFRLELVEYIYPKSEFARNFDNNIIGKVHLCFTVTQIEKVIMKVIKNGGFSPFNQVLDISGTHKYVYVFDPDKNPLELAENLNKS
jgi:catechol 2,3-dioxygenase-like lactoylglutathione lyase family enzyme